MADSTNALQAWRFKNVLRVVDHWTPPSGPFDPAGAWEHTYHIYFLNIRAKSPWPGKGKAPAATPAPAKGKGKGKGKGAAAASTAQVAAQTATADEPVPPPNATLKIAAAPKAGGIELLAEYSALMYSDLTSARIQCKNDALCTPLSWELRFTNKRPGGSELVTFSKTGAVKDGALIKDGKPAKGFKRLGAYTCDWSLFEAIQRMGRDNFGASLTCDMLEYLDVLRGNQTLKFRGQTQVKCGGQTIEAREYLQYGEAVLPTQYYLDPQNRLFMALGSRRLFVLVNEKA